MADKRISELTAATALADADLLPIVQGGETKKLTGSAVKAYVASTDQPSVISVNSASDALRITQTGAGNALVVEDSTNPDSTPFVIDQSGNVISGNTTTFSTALSIAPQFSLGNIGNGSGAGITIAKFRNAASFGPDLEFTKSRASAIGVNALVSGTDLLGTITFSGADGTGYIQAASIAAWTDGTPGTNDMPGRLVFSTTKDGASSPTEAMRIDSGQSVGIGSTTLTGYSLRIGKNMTGATSAFGVQSNGAIQSDVTGGAYMFRTAPTTLAATFTVSTLAHYDAAQGAIGAGSTVTNQYGFVANSSLTGATNNYGFYSSIASGTGRYNFYSAGSASNYFGGDTVISVNSSTDALRITQTGSGNALVVEDSANPDSTPFVVDAAGKVIVGATAGVTVGGSSIRSVQVSGTGNDATIAVMGYSNSTTGAGTGLILARSRGAASGDFTTLQNGDLVSQINFVGADGTTLNSIAATIETRVDGTPGTNDMPGRLVFSTTADGASSPTERMRISSTGTVGIGTTSISNVNLFVNKNITGAVSSFGIASVGAVQSDVTTQAQNYRSVVNTAASSFTLPTLVHFYSGQGTIGAGSAVTNQFGFYAETTITGATNNYGFYSNIASGTGRYNFYAAGTADNYFAGLVGVGTTTVGGYNGTLVVGGYGSPTAGYLEGFHSNMAISSAVTARHDAFLSSAYTVAAAFTLPILRHFSAQQGGFGAGSVVNNQYGFYADSGLTGATNNYGFYSNIASGTGRYSFYAAGTADNYFAGNVGIGTSSPNARLTAQAIGNGYANSAGLSLKSYAGNATAYITLAEAAGVGTLYISNGGSSDHLVLSSSGNLGLGVTPSAWSGMGGLQLVGGASFVANGSRSYINANAYWDGTNWLRLVALPVVQQVNDNTSGSFVWQNALTGAAGSAISWTQAMTLNGDGRLYLKQTGQSGNTLQRMGLTYNGALEWGLNITTSSNSGNAINFTNSAGTQIGQVQLTSSVTSYVTSSDQRLKTNVAPADSAIQSILDFPVDQFDWISTGEHQDFGGVAQKIRPIIPEMVSVPADESEMWGIDWSKANPRLIRAFQELEARVATLEARIH